jgi:hypothetical protein
MVAHTIGRNPVILTAGDGPKPMSGPVRIGRFTCDRCKARAEQFAIDRPTDLGRSWDFPSPPGWVEVSGKILCAECFHAFTEFLNLEGSAAT